ncbi:hypothetical protein EI94DRAFT_1816186 [Lactarius quietus]|nr:hypothetical protein EI94DRAFT_1816186 [Lactarius quietus]
MIYALLAALPQDSTTTTMHDALLFCLVLPPSMAVIGPSAKEAKSVQYIDSFSQELASAERTLLLQCPFPLLETKQMVQQLQARGRQSFVVLPKPPHGEDPLREQLPPKSNYKTIFSSVDELLSWLDAGDNLKSFYLVPILPMLLKPALLAFALQPPIIPKTKSSSSTKNSKHKEARAHVPFP